MGDIMEAISVNLDGIEGKALKHMFAFKLCMMGDDSGINKLGLTYGEALARADGLIALGGLDYISIAEKAQALAAACVCGLVTDAKGSVAGYLTA